jgi:hypothetical protein
MIDAGKIVGVAYDFGHSTNNLANCRIDEVNRQIAKFSDGKIIRFVDIKHKFADENGRFFEGMVNPGKLHPTIKAFQIWADALQPIFDKILGPRAATDLALLLTGEPSAESKK